MPSPVSRRGGSPRLSLCRQQSAKEKKKEKNTGRVSEAPDRRVRPIRRVVGVNGDIFADARALSTMVPLTFSAGMAVPPPLLSLSDDSVGGGEAPRAMPVLMIQGSMDTGETRRERERERQR